eukprot:7346795-Pyramimonas_sp.AAC.1
MVFGSPLGGGGDPSRLRYDRLVVARLAPVCCDPACPPSACRVAPRDPAPSTLRPGVKRAQPCL